MIPLNGFTCFLGAAALYLISRITGRDAEILKSVTRVCQLKDLAELVEEESKVSPLLVAVSGRVGSKTPIESELSGISCVLVKETVEQHFLKLNWKFSWVKDSGFLQPLCKEVPWYLDDGTARVNVAGAQGATGFALIAGNEVVEKAKPSSLVRGSLDYLRGLKMLGVNRIERVLPIGTPLTVIGEAVKDGSGDFRIQKPEMGPFYVSPIPVNEIVPKFGELSRNLKYASIGLTALGVILISKPVIGYIIERIEYTLKRIADKRKRTRNILERRRQLLLEQQRLFDAAAERARLASRGPKSQHKKSSDGGTSRDGEGTDTCVICLDQKYNAAFIPCGHLCCCLICALKLQEKPYPKPCPLCREPIFHVQKIYRH